MAMDSYEVALWVVIFTLSVLLSGITFIAGERNRQTDRRQIIRLWFTEKEINYRIAMFKLEEYSEWCMNNRNNQRHLHFPLLHFQAQLPFNDVRRIKEAELYREIAASYWDAVLLDHLETKYTDDSFFIISQWEKYRTLVEPMDIAYFYGMSMDEERGDYCLDGNNNIPARYRVVEEMWLKSLNVADKESAAIWWKESRINVCEQVKGLRERMRNRPHEMHIEIGESN